VEPTLLELVKIVKKIKKIFDLAKIIQLLLFNPEIFNAIII